VYLDNEQIVIDEPQRNERQGTQEIDAHDIHIRRPVQRDGCRGDVQEQQQDQKDIKHVSAPSVAIDLTKVVNVVQCDE